MKYLFLVIAGLAAFHAYTYAKWLKTSGNKVGTYGIYVLILIGLALPVYSLLRDI